MYKCVVVFLSFCCLNKMIFFVEIADCCSLDIDNAFVSCSTNNMSCIAECYPGYIFPSGSTKDYYNCQIGWIPFLSSCKRMLLNMLMV